MVLKQRCMCHWGVGTFTLTPPSYTVNLSQLMLLKTEGRSISGCPTVERLVETRTVSVL